MHFKMSSAICFNLDQSKILWYGNKLNHTGNRLSHFRGIPCLMWLWHDHLLFPTMHALYRSRIEQDWSEPCIESNMGAVHYLLVLSATFSISVSFIFEHPHARCQTSLVDAFPGCAGLFNDTSTLQQTMTDFQKTLENLKKDIGK